MAATNNLFGGDVAQPAGPTGHPPYAIIPWSGENGNYFPTFEYPFELTPERWAKLFARQNQLGVEFSASFDTGGTPITISCVFAINNNDPVNFAGELDVMTNSKDSGRSWLGTYDASIPGDTRIVAGEFILMEGFTGTSYFWREPATILPRMQMRIGVNWTQGLDVVGDFLYTGTGSLNTPILEFGSVNLEWIGSLPLISYSGRFVSHSYFPFNDTFGNPKVNTTTGELL